MLADPIALLITVVTGLLIGFSMGTVGGGGAILAVPVLTYGLGQSPLQATTGSLLVVGATAVLGSVLAVRRGRADLGQGVVFGALAIIGAALGAVAASRVPDAVLMGCFTILMVVVATMMVRKLVRPAGGRGQSAQQTQSANQGDGANQVDGVRPSDAADQGATDRGATDQAATDRGGRRAALVRLVLVASLVGFLTGFLGVGGGFMIVPALTLLVGVPMRQASGTSLVVIAITSASGLLTRLVQSPATVQPQWPVVGVLTGLAVVGLLLGNAVANRANNRQLSIGFAALVVAVAIFTAIRTVPLLF